MIHTRFQGGSDDKHELPLPQLNLEVDNLSLDSVNEIISDLTGHGLERTLPLSEIVWKRTVGNPFFIRQFLDTLEREEVLRFSNQQWQWDLLTILEANFQRSVTELTEAKIQDQSDHVLQVLKLASCLGSRFDTDVLNAVVLQENAEIMNSNKQSDTKINAAIIAKQVASILDEATGAGIIECHSFKEYKFCHDGFADKFYALTPKGPQLECMHLRIGYVIFDKLANVSAVDDNEEALFFQCVDQLNRGAPQILDRQKKLDLVGMNLLAGKHAAGKSAFGLASTYFRIGIIYLEKDGGLWETHYDLSLDFFSCLAVSEMCVGHFELSDETIDEVLIHAKTLHDKLRVYYTKIDSILARGKLRVAMNLAFAILRELGQRFPQTPNTLHVMVEFAKTKLILSETTDDSLLHREFTKEPDKVAVMKLLSLIACCAYQTSQHGKAYPMVALRMMQLSQQDGLTSMSPHGFACFAALNCFNENFNEGMRFSTLALRLLDTMKSKESEPRTLTTIILCW